jgi:hypothetical protein
MCLLFKLIYLTFKLVNLEFKLIAWSKVEACGDVIIGIDFDGFFLFW